MQMYFYTTFPSTDVQSHVGYGPLYLASCPSIVCCRALFDGIHSVGLPVLGLDIVGKGLGLLVAVVVVVAVAIVGRSDVLHLINATALGASLNRSRARHLKQVAHDVSLLNTRWAEGGGWQTYTEPDDNVGVGGGAGAANVLLITRRLDNDGVVEGS